MPYVSFDIFEDSLCTRRDNVRDWWGWEIPDCIWDYAMERLKESDGLADPELNTPSYIVDNIAVNGSWEEFDDLRKFYDKYRRMNDNQIAAELERKGDCFAVFREEKIVLWNLGI